MVDAKLRGNTMCYSKGDPTVAKMNEPIKLVLGYDSIKPENIAISLDVFAYKVINPNSDANDIELVVDKSLLQQARVEEREIPYTIIVKDEGEFVIRHQFSIGEGHLRTYEYKIIARDGVVAVGSFFRSCERLLLMNKYGLDSDTKYPDLPKTIKEELDKIDEFRWHKEYEFNELENNRNTENSVSNKTKGAVIPIPEETSKTNTFTVYWEHRAEKFSIIDSKIEVVGSDGVVITNGVLQADNLKSGGVFR